MAIAGETYIMIDNHDQLLYLVRGGYNYGSTAIRPRDEHSTTYVT